MAVLLLPKYLLPVRPPGSVYEQYAVAIEDGRIHALLPRDEALEQFPDAERVELGSHVLLPGMINMHTHSAMTLLRGYADDLQLDSWLKEYIWPAERRWADGDFVRDGTELALAEMIRGGTTCFNENYFYPDAIAQAVDQSGMRACIGIPVIDLKTGWAAGFEQYLQKGMDVRSRFSGSERLMFAIAPHSLYSVSDPAFEQIGTLADEFKLPVHMHLLETEWEIEHSISEHGIRPLQRVQKLGLLNDRLIAVHMAHLTDEDVGLLAEHAVNVVHCPQSNLKLASGMCRVADLLAAGVNVSVGTDGAAANNDLDLLDELQTAVLLAKGVASDPGALAAVAALDLVTLNAARALGLEAELGTIEAGKMADLCAIDLHDPRTQPVHHVISQVIYAASSSQVSDVWVAGRRLLENGTLTTLDEQRILNKAAEWATLMRTGIA